MEPSPDTQPDQQRQSPLVRRLRRISLVIAGVLVILYAGIGWYISGEILGGLRVDQWEDENENEIGIVSIGDGTITLEVPEISSRDADRDATMGLRWANGYGQVGPASSSDEAIEVRPFLLIDGSEPPLGSGIARFDSFAFPSDPSVLGVEFETVTYDGPLGELEAWRLPGGGSTWIIAVHGLGADRTEFLRFIDATDQLDYPMLIVRYRNDEGAPTANDLMIMAGQDEWEDVAAAIDYAIAGGASDVVIYGASMGGALTLGYALNGDQDVVRALILESPVADIRAVVDLRSGEALPIGGPIGDSLLAAGRAVTWLRTGLDFDTVDYVDRADELTMPVLLFHGDADDTIPYEVGVALAEARPDLVEFHPLENAAHVRAWNEGPDEYRSTVAAFLDRIGRSN